MYIYLYFNILSNLLKMYTLENITPFSLCIHSRVCEFGIIIFANVFTRSVIRKSYRNVENYHMTLNTTFNVV